MDIITNMEYNVAETLEDIMIRYKLSQVEFAKLVGVKQSQVSEWLNGKAKPGYDNLRRICIALEISGDEILNLRMPRH